MHLPLLHISDRLARGKDPLGIGPLEGEDVIGWLADPEAAIAFARRRSKAGDVASLIAAAAGSEMMYFALLGGLYGAFNRRTALSLAAVILPSVFTNQWVKARIRFPRPPLEARHELAFVAPGDNTFPSGHAQNAVVLGLFLISRSYRGSLQALGLALASMIPLSRVYLGVHYPRDVLAGAALGVAVVAGVRAVEDPFVAWWERSPRGPRSFTVAIALAIAGVLSGSSLAAFPLGIGAGLAVGHDFSGEKRLELDRPHGSRRIVQGAVGLVMTFGAGFAIRPLLKRETSMAGLVAGGLVGTALTFGVPLVSDFIQRFRLMRDRWRRGRSATHWRGRR
ncbi:MAG: hypothetical protein MAG453_01630 [Calditrichaeota bacterium]|nr:hypothetical protein [Calditrichota bacterium]